MIHGSPGRSGIVSSCDGIDHLREHFVKDAGLYGGAHRVPRQAAVGRFFCFFSENLMALGEIFRSHH